MLAEVQLKKFAVPRGLVLPPAVSRVLTLALNVVGPLLVGEGGGLTGGALGSCQRSDWGGAALLGSGAVLVCGGVGRGYVREALG
jgi:hypothetical protein